MNARLFLLLPAVVVAGCASSGLSGIGGSSEYSCAAPPGVSCMSITGLNANADKKTLPAMRHRAEDERVEDKDSKEGKEGKEGKKAPVAYHPQGAGSSDQIARVSPKTMDAPYSGTPLRTPARILRIWLAPFEDADLDLHDQKYVYVTIHTGRWVLEANQVNIQPQFKHVFPLGRKDQDEKEDKSKGAAPAVDANGEPLAVTGKGQ
jgi:conjugal transfer pilus assembly protein TraV